jgi:AcrR family transcriptional regulator
MQREKSAREKQAEETKLRIKDSAYELFREKGYNNTSIEEILKRSNSSIGGFYHHFKNKDDIIIYAMELLDDDYKEYFDKMINSKEYSNKDYINKIKDIIIYIINVVSSGGDELVRIAYSYMMKEKSMSLKMTDRNREYFKIITYLLKQAKEEGVVREDLIIGDILDYITIIIRGIIVDWSVNRNTYDLNERSNIIIDLFLSSIIKKI